MPEAFGTKFEIKDQKYAEVLIESACFRIDPVFKSIHALALLSALQTYVRDCAKKTESWNKMYKQNRIHKLKLTIACEDVTMLDFLSRWLRREKVSSFAYCDTLKDFTVSNFDYYVDITLEKVLDLCRVGPLHLSQGIAILIGCNADSLADLTHGEDTACETGTLLLSDIKGLYSLIDYEDLFGSKFKTIIDIDEHIEESMSDVLIQTIQKSEAVIGRRGFATYAASCFRKPVLEFIDTKQDFQLLTQWSNKFYLPAILDENQSEVARKGVAKLWDQVHSHRVSLIQMEHAMSTAGNACAN